MPPVEQRTDEEELDVIQPTGARTDGLDIQDADDAADAETEERARAERMGWADKEHWRGDPDQWVDYKTFLKRGEERLPVLQERLRKQDEQIAAFRRELKGVIQGQGEIERQTRERMQREFDERQREAVANADMAAYDQAAKERREYEAANPPKPQPTERKDDNYDPHFDEWAQQNTWYGEQGNADMTRYANAMGSYVLAEKPDVKGTPKFYTEVEKLVRERYPNHFENPERNRPNAVGGARGGGAGGRGGKKTYADLPQAAKTICDRYVSEGLVKDREQYVRGYFDEE